MKYRILIRGLKMNRKKKVRQKNNLINFNIEQTIKFFSVLDAPRDLRKRNTNKTENIK